MDQQCERLPAFVCESLEQQGRGKMRTSATFSLLDLMWLTSQHNYVYNLEIRATVQQIEGNIEYLVYTEGFWNCG